MLHILGNDEKRHLFMQCVSNTDKHCVINVRSKMCNFNLTEDWEETNVSAQFVSLITKT